MKFRKSILAAGTYHKGGTTIRVSPDDLRTAIESHGKIVAKGYKIPVIIEHSAHDDKNGLPFKSKSQQMSIRDLAKYQEGWSDTLRLNDAGEIEADIDVRGRDGLKLIQEVGTYISPQFGRWKDPETGEELPMAVTHLALTPFPVAINQNPEFREIQDSAEVVEASQLSHLVSFSMADLVELGQLSFNFKEDDHPRNESGEFTKKGGGSPKAATEHKSPEHKASEVKQPEFHDMVRIAAGYQFHGMNAEPEDRAGSRKHQKHMTKSALDAWLMKKYGLDASDARAVSNAAGEMSAYETTGGGTREGEHVEWIHKSKVPSLEELGDVPWGKSANTDAPQKPSVEDHPAHQAASLLAKNLTGGHLNDPHEFRDAYRELSDDHKKLVVKHLHERGLIHPKDARKRTVQSASDIIDSARGAYHAAEFDHKAVATNRHEPWKESETFKKMAHGTQTQMGQSMPFPQKSDIGDVDENDNGVIDSEEDSDDSQETPDETPPEKPTVPSPVDDKPAEDPIVWAQIAQALKQIGVIVPDATNAHALLAGLLTCAHHTGKNEAEEAAEKFQANNQQAAPQPQLNGQDPRLQGTRQEQSFTMSQSNNKPSDFKTMPEWIQMSTTNQRMEAELSQMKKDKYASRIQECFTTGRLTKPMADDLMSLVSTYQFSTADTTSEILKLNAKLEVIEALPKGAIWSPAERAAQMSVVEQPNPGFFADNGQQAASDDEENADIERRFGKLTV